MSELETIGVTSGGHTFTVVTAVPTSLEEAVNLYGDDIVFDRFKRQMIVELRTRITAAGKTVKDVQVAADTWPSSRKSGFTKQQKIVHELANNPDLLGEVVKLAGLNFHKGESESPENRHTEILLDFSAEDEVTEADLERVASEESEDPIQYQS